MRSLSDVQVFVRVVEEGTFTAAAETLGISTSYASRQVKALEERLGAVLLARTTRSTSLTDVGRAYYERVAPLLEGLDDADQAVSSLAGEPRGTLRLATPVSFGLRYLSSALASFACRWPELRLDVAVSDRMVDLVADGFDLAVRGGRLADSSLFARRLAPFRGLLVGSPAYLERRGTPRTPADLDAHDGLLYTASVTRPGWWFRGPGGETVARPRPRMLADNGDTLAEAAIAGLGLAYQPEFIVGDALGDGRLVRLLPDHETFTGAIWAVYPHRRHLAAKVRLFVDFLVRRWQDPPWSVDRA